MSKRTKTIFIIAIVLLAYGYGCRMLDIFFFWESKLFGWIAAFIGLTSLLFDVHKSRKRQKKSTVFAKIGIAFFSLGLGVLPFAVVAVMSSDAYDAATFYLETDPKIRSEVGNVQGFGLMPTGAVSQASYNGAVSGDANFTIIVKGDKKFKDLTVYLRRTPGTPWTVYYIE
jgi:hypothetical protein